MMVPLAVAQRSLPRPRFLLEFLVGAALMASFLAVLLREPGVHRGLLAFGYLAFLLLMAVQDIRSLQVPNRIVYPALTFGVAASLTLGRSDASEALLGGVVAFALLLVVALLGRGAMGFGDVKVGGFCGIVVGLSGVLPMLFLAFLSGALVAGPLLALRIRKPKDVIAFAPFLAAATAFSISYFHLYLLS
jgi:prepilin signal peptidase PulO-like enzyme (type II secretory pathway)